MEVQALPTTFAECNESITCFALVGILRILLGVECGHLLELKKLALSYDASLLHNVPNDLGKIARKLVTHWWTRHGMPYCMQKLEEENRVSFAIIHFSRQGYYFLIMTLVLAQPKVDNDPEGDGASRAGKDTQAEASIVKIAEREAASATSGTGGDTQVEASTTKVAAEKAATTGVAEASPKAEIPHQSEV
jgi:hypothetical protein